jgi:hypothetical protein
MSWKAKCVCGSIQFLQINKDIVECEGCGKMLKNISDFKEQI